MKKQIIISSSINAINNTVCVVACLAVYLSNEIEFKERAIYTMSAIVVWLGVQRLVNKFFPKL